MWRIAFMSHPSFVVTRLHTNISARNSIVDLFYYPHISLLNINSQKIRQMCLNSSCLPSASYRYLKYIVPLSLLENITTEPHAHDISADIVRVWLSGYILQQYVCVLGACMRV